MYKELSYKTCPTPTAPRPPLYTPTQTWWQPPSLAPHKVATIKWNGGGEEKQDEVAKDGARGAGARSSGAGGLSTTRWGRWGEKRKQKASQEEAPPPTRPPTSRSNLIRMQTGTPRQGDWMGEVSGFFEIFIFGILKKGVCEGDSGEGVHLPQKILSRHQILCQEQTLVWLWGGAPTPAPSSSCLFSSPPPI